MSTTDTPIATGRHIGTVHAFYYFDGKRWEMVQIGDRFYLQARQNGTVFYQSEFVDFSSLRSAFMAVVRDTLTGQTNG